MHFQLFISPLALLFTTLTTSAPTSLSKRWDESIPWKLSDITLFDAAPDSGLKSSLMFTLQDLNPERALTQHCTRTANKTEWLNSNFYQGCPDKDFQFQYQGDNIISIMRYIKDDSFGGNDGTWCKGSQQLTLFDHSASQNGTLRTQGCMEVYCTIQVG